MAPKKKLPWFRFHVEALADVKLRRMKPEHRWLWVAILGTARSSPVTGWLMISDREPCTPEDLADIAAVPVKAVKAGLDLMARAEMIEHDPDLGAWRVTNWDKRQYPSDSSSERVAKHRAKTVPETPMERYIDVPVTPPENREQNTEPSKPASQPPTVTPAVVLAKQACLVIAFQQIAERVASGAIGNPQAVAERRAKDDLWPILGPALTSLAEANPAATAERVAALAEVDPLTGFATNGSTQRRADETRPALSNLVVDEIRHQADEALPPADGLAQVRAIRGQAS